MYSRFSLVIAERALILRFRGLEAADDAFKTASLSSGRIIKSDDGMEWLYGVKLTYPHFTFSRLKVN
jgi:hypothetical protein